MYSVVVKPIGNLQFEMQYCFYLEKEELYPDQNHFRMTDETLSCLSNSILLRGLVRQSILPGRVVNPPC